MYTQIKKTSPKTRKKDSSSSKKQKKDSSSSNNINADLLKQSQI
jgi:hypothetical protein